MDQNQNQKLTNQKLTDAQSKLIAEKQSAIMELHAARLKLATINQELLRQCLLYSVDVDGLEGKITVMACCW